MEDQDLVRLCASSYDHTFTGWEHFWDGTAPDGICAGIINNSLICRGSITRQDWLRDFEVFHFGEGKAHPQFGIIHAGFDEGLDEFAAKALPLLRDGAYFSGHSLGAAHAYLLAGRYILEGRSPAGITVFGAPKPGCLQFAEFISRVKKSSYRNGCDPVTEVPLVIGTDTAIAPTSAKPLMERPTDWSEGLMAWHNINLYEAGVAAAGH